MDFGRYDYLMFQIERLKESIIELRAQAEGMTKPLTGDDVQGGGGGDMIARIVSEIMQKEARIDELTAEAELAKSRIDQRINAIQNQTEREIFRRRFIERQPVSKIAWDMHLSPRWIYYALRKRDSFPHK